MGMYIPNMRPDQFYDLCKEHGLEIIAVPVPEHGRLGDLDKLVDNMRSATAGRGGRVMTCDELMSSILTAQEQMLQHSIEANSVTLNGRKYGKLIENLPPNIKPTIFGMAVKADYGLPDDYDFLVQHEPPKLKSNADRIRAMTDEELAKWLNHMQTDAYDRGMLEDRIIGYPNNYDNWLDWLRQEATDG